MALPAVLRAQRSTSPATGAPAQASAKTPLALVGVTVVDVQRGRLIPNQTVVIIGNRLHEVGPTRRVRVPRGARVIPAQGKYLLPGLWDMHAHVLTYPHIAYPLFIANGVTGVREMGTPLLDSMQHWRREVTAGTRVGPRVLVPGPLLTDAAIAVGWNPDYLLKDRGIDRLLGRAITGPEDGRHVVDSVKAAGADFIKVYSGLSREAYFAIAVEARRLSLPFAGHLPAGVTPAEASDSGQHSIEHLVQMFRYNLKVVEAKPNPVTDICTRLDSASVEQCTALGARFSRNHTWITPTMVVQYYDVGHPIKLPQHTLKGIRPPFEKLLEGADEAMELQYKAVRAFRRVGIPLLAGTDASQLTPTVVPGFSLHEELGLLVQAGLTPLEAPQSGAVLWGDRLAGHGHPGRAGGLAPPGRQPAGGHPQHDCHPGGRGGRALLRSRHPRCAPHRSRTRCGGEQIRRITRSNGRCVTPYSASPPQSR